MKQGGGKSCQTGVSFAEAKTVFGDPLYLDFYDPDRSADEPPYIIIGI